MWRGPLDGYFFLDTSEHAELAASRACGGRHSLLLLNVWCDHFLIVRLLLEKLFFLLVVCVCVCVPIAICPATGVIH